MCVYHNILCKWTGWGLGAPRQKMKAKVYAMASIRHPLQMHSWSKRGVFFFFWNGFSYYDLIFHASECSQSPPIQQGSHHTWNISGEVNEISSSVVVHIQWRTSRQMPRGTELPYKWEKSTAWPILDTVPSKCEDIQTHFQLQERSVWGTRAASNCPQVGRLVDT